MKTSITRLSPSTAMCFAANAKWVLQSIYIMLFWNLKKITLSYVSARYEKVLTSGFQETSVNSFFVTSADKTQQFIKLNALV